jgi:hypothetical protein
MTPDEVAWATVLETAPWLLGTTEPGETIPPDELYERLEPFKRRIAEGSPREATQGLRACHLG